MADPEVLLNQAEMTDAIRSITVALQEMTDAIDALKVYLEAQAKHFDRNGTNPVPGTIHAAKRAGVPVDQIAVDRTPRVPTPYPTPPHL